jgi:hypothetical protein
MTGFLGNIRLSLAWVAVAACGGLLAWSIWVRVPAPTDASESAVPNRVQSGKEVLSIFITAAGCGPSHAPELPDALSRINASLEKISGSASPPVKIGVALDHYPKTGLDFLSRFGTFDELIAGGSWLNSASVTWLIRGGERLDTPQLLVVERDVEALQSSLRVGQDRVVDRAVGVEEILALAARLDGTTK